MTVSSSWATFEQNCFSEIKNSITPVCLGFSVVASAGAGGRSWLVDLDLKFMVFVSVVRLVDIERECVKGIGVAYAISDRACKIITGIEHASSALNYKNL